MMWRLGIKTNLDIISQGEWDGPAAKDEILKWSGLGEDDFDPAKARSGFLFYEDQVENLKGGYSFPITRPVSGELIAIKEGVSAALGFLKRGLDDDNLNVPKVLARSGIKVCEAYLEKFNEESEKLGASSDSFGGFKFFLSGIQ